MRSEKQNAFLENILQERSDLMWDTTDKVYWHRYDEFYEREVFSVIMPRQVMEIGVLDGDSIRFLSKRFPGADIHGVDIVPQNQNWPTDSKIVYHQICESSNAIAELLAKVGIQYELIIDDASHTAQNQMDNLIPGLIYTRQNGYYIIEDLNPRLLNLFLLLEHRKKIKSPIPPLVLEDFNSPLFSSLVISSLDKAIKRIYIYKRSTLPLFCYRCGGNDFNYKLLMCKCGTYLYATDDSRAVIIQKS